MWYPRRYQWPYSPNYPHLFYFSNFLPSFKPFNWLSPSCPQAFFSPFPCNMGKGKRGRQQNGRNRASEVSWNWFISLLLPKLIWNQDWTAVMFDHLKTQTSASDETVRKIYTELPNQLQIQVVRPEKTVGNNEGLLVKKLDSLQRQIDRKRGLLNLSQNLRLLASSKYCT